MVQFAPNVAVQEESYEKPGDSRLGLAKDGLADVVDGFEDVRADSEDLTKYRTHSQISKTS